MSAHMPRPDLETLALLVDVLRVLAPGAVWLAIMQLAGLL